MASPYTSTGATPLLFAVRSQQANEQRPLLVDVDRINASLASTRVVAPQGMSSGEKLRFLLNPPAQLR